MIGYIEVECRIFETHSLKEKRAVLKKVINRLKQKFNISAAEIDHQDLWQLAKIAIVTVSSSRQAAERELDHALKFIDSFPEWERIHTTYEWL